MATHISVTTTGAALMGLPISGSSSTLVYVTSTAHLPVDDTPQSVTGLAGLSVVGIPVNGKVVASGIGISMVSVLCNNPLLVCSIMGQGASSASINTSLPILGLS